MTFRILAISDTHFSGPEMAEFCMKFLEKDSYDVIVHAGDFDRKESYEVLKEFCEERGIELLAVRGNCDRFDLEEVLLIESGESRSSEGSGGLRIAAKHEPVMEDCSDMYYLARELEADLLVFGHIHRFAVVSSKPLVFCPGAVKKGQFAVIEVDDSHLLTLRFFEGGKEVDSAVFEV